MPDSIMYQGDAYVVLEPDLPEQFLTAPELLEKLQGVIVAHPENLPRELKKFASVEEQAQFLLTNYCDFDLAPGEYLQWYLVRLEK
ncbi:chlororespiratory reduction protein 7 [Gloeocapsa sp. PCC 73106]|uniref:chlororespiratory reduction protein 7 n=1 Tax=Gloeocapsa sp. PCC 73106 TaxID=102232 RepID=UPI0002AC14F3|nr:chlororespiratory reduction protein 7 [Gloeocapsa sp. PCC 73106]ELR96736.1 Protein of unknown function (DUF3571) [Gloeocapsa sp. PCC 73106]